MISQKIKRAIQDKKCLPVKFLMSGKITGSFVFGDYVEGISDIDVLIPYDQIDTLISPEQYLHAGDMYTNHEEVASLYRKSSEGTVVNVLTSKNARCITNWSLATASWLLTATAARRLQRPWLIVRNTDINSLN